MSRAAALLILAAVPASAHRLDEYLQATLISVESHRLEAEMTLTPGVAIAPYLMPDLDAGPQSYAARVLNDLRLSIDGRKLTPRLTSVRFPAPADIMEGKGEIHLYFTADLPPGPRERQLTIENRHHPQISAYLVNCLVPKDPHIQIQKQNRNYQQSLYRLEFIDTAAPPSNHALWLAPVGLLLIARLASLRRLHPHPSEPRP